YDIYPKYINGGILPPFEESLIWKNVYYLSQPKSDRNIYYWRFTRTIKYAINSDILSYFGTPKYIKQSYIESNIQAVPFADTIFNESFITNSSTQANRVLYAMFQFAADPNTYLKEEREQKNEYGKSLSPFVVDSQSNGFDAKEKSDTKEHEISSILKRLENLEKSDRFYKEYIIDVSFLSFAKTDASLANNSNSSL
ncbi:30977_t:CDS:2, partial [Gigaspora margarita]